MTSPIHDSMPLLFPRIRRAEAGDAEALAAIGAATFADACTSGTPADHMSWYIDTELSVEKFAKHIRSTSAATFVGVIDEAVRGFVMMEPTAVRNALDFARPIALARLYVLHAWHGSGLAEELLHYGMRHAVALAGC